MTQTTIQMSPGDDVHLTLLMAPQSLNLVTGQDREHLLAFGRAAFEAGKAITEQGKCLHQIAEPQKFTCESEMSRAFEIEHGQSWSDPDWRREAGIWASAWRKATAAAKAAPLASVVQSSEPMYYQQDARWSSMVGNCPSFWREGGNGYTTNLDEAGRFSFDDAMSQHRSRDTDLPWLCSELDKLRHSTIDHQSMPHSWDDQRAALAAQKCGEA